MLKKKYIAIFSGYMLPHLGGIERYTDNLIREFNKLGYGTILVTSNYNNAKGIEKTNENVVIRLPVYKMFKDRYPILKHNKNFKLLMSTLDDYNIYSIIVNTRFHLTSHAGAKYGYKKNIPVHLIEHGSNYVTLDNKFIDFFANKYEDFLTRKIRKKITSFNGVSNACGNWLKKIKINMNSTWYNSIDTNQKLPDREKHNTINFLYAGRLIKQKGVENILNAFSELNSSYKNIKLFIAGDGPELDNYKRRFNMENIEFLGKLNYSDLVKYYAKTDVFLYPPLWPEGLPTSILEAGLMKCVVIGTNQGGIKEIIDDGKNGIIVDTNADSLYKAMKSLIDDEKLLKKYSKEIYKTIINKFSWEKNAKKILGDMDAKKEIK